MRRRHGPREPTYSRKLTDGGFVAEVRNMPDCPVPGCENIAGAIGTLPTDRDGRMLAVFPCDDHRKIHGENPFVVPEEVRARKTIMPFSALEFSEAFKRMASRLPSRKITADMIDGYYDYLAGKVDRDEMRRGLRWAFHNLKQFPSPAELRSICLGTYGKGGDR